MENKEARVYFDDSESYFTYIFNPSREIVYDTLGLLLQNSLGKNKVQAAIRELENFWVSDNDTIHSFIIKVERSIIGLVVGNIRTVTSPVGPDYNVFVSRFMKVDPNYGKHFRKLTSDVIFQMNRKFSIIAILGNDCGYKNTAGTIGIWVRPLRTKKNQQLPKGKVINPKKFLPKTGDFTKWILHDGTHDLAGLMNWYLLQKNVTFIKYNQAEATLLKGKNIKVYHDACFTKIFAFVEQTPDEKSCMVFYIHGVKPEEIAAFLYRTTKYEYMRLVVPGALRKPIIMDIIDDIHAGIYFDQKTTIINQILLNPDFEKIDLVPVGNELLESIF